MIKTAYFYGFEISMSTEQAKLAAHAGQCDDDVVALACDPTIRAQLDAIPDDKLVAELKEYGAWDAEQLRDREENLMRILWFAAGNINDENPSTKLWDEPYGE